MELTERKLKILQAIIDNYIRSAEPVGSRTLSKQFDGAVSAATIRNEMSDLEEMGYLTHPHTSAGRVPSNQAYRLYVNNLMKRVELPEKEKQFINDTLNKDIDQLDQLIERAADVLSEITSLAAFAISPSQSDDTLKFVNLIPVDERTVIMMIVADSGKSQNTLMHLNVPYTDESLKILAKKLTVNYRGRKLTDVLKARLVNDFQGDIEAMSRLGESIMPNFMKTLEEMLNVNLYMDGLSNIFDIPEFSDLSRAKEFVSLFDRKEQLVQELMQRADGMVVTIGDENVSDSLSDYSLITATYHVNGRFVGKLGVIGPTRMKYGEITSVMKYLTDNLDKAFTMNEEKDKDDG